MPTTPGLGVEIDEGALDRYRVEKAQVNLPRRVICYRRSSGLTVYFPTTSHPGSSMWNYFVAGNQPAYEQGVVTKLIEDDGSVEFQQLYKKVSTCPFLETLDTKSHARS